MLYKVEVFRNGPALPRERLVEGSTNHEQNQQSCRAGSFHQRTVRGSYSTRDQPSEVS